MIRSIVGQMNKVTVECDFCFDTIAVGCRYLKNQKGGRPDEGQAIRKAREHGWVTIGGKTRCKACEAHRHERLQIAPAAKESLPQPGLVMTFAPLAKPVIVTPGQEVDPRVPGLSAADGMWDVPALLKPSMPDDPKRGSHAATNIRLDRLKAYHAAGRTDLHELANLVSAHYDTVARDLKALGLQYTLKGHYHPARSSSPSKSQHKPATEPAMTKTDQDYRAPTIPKVGASEDPLREPTIAQRRAIREMLDACYDSDRPGYTGGETDFTVAKEVGAGILPGWVAMIRESGYGPAGNADLDKLIASMEALLAKSISDARELASLGGDLDRLQRAHTATQRDIADMNAQVGRIKAAMGPKGARL